MDGNEKLSVVVFVEALRILESQPTRALTEMTRQAKLFAEVRATDSAGLVDSSNRLGFCPMIQ